LQRFATLNRHSEPGALVAQFLNLIKDLPANRRLDNWQFWPNITIWLIKSIKRLNFSCHKPKFLNNIWCSLPEV